MNSEKLSKPEVEELTNLFMEDELGLEIMDPPFYDQSQKCIYTDTKKVFQFKYMCTKSSSKIQILLQLENNDVIGKQKLKPCNKCSPNFPSILKIMEESCIRHTEYKYLEKVGQMTEIDFCTANPIFSVQMCCLSSHFKQNKFKLTFKTLEPCTRSLGTYFVHTSCNPKRTFETLPSVKNEMDDNEEESQEPPAKKRKSEMRVRYVVTVPYSKKEVFLLNLMEVDHEKKVTGL